MKKFIKNLLNKRLNNEKGLTLIELLAVIVILAIIAAIAIPAVGNIINSQRDKAQLANMSGVISAAKIANAAGECNSDNDPICSQAELTGYVDNNIIGNVTSVNPSNWELVYTLPDDLLTDNVAVDLGGAGSTAANYPATTVVTITEANLNTAMGN